MNKKLKAYLINNGAIYKDRDDLEGFICFHYTAREARKEFWSSFESGLDTYLDNRVLRAECFDKYLKGDKPYIIDSDVDWKIYYEQGWPEYEDTFKCDFCERYEYREVESSKVGCSECELCIDCKGRYGCSADCVDNNVK